MKWNDLENMKKILAEISDLLINLEGEVNNTIPEKVPEEDELGLDSLFTSTPTIIDKAIKAYEKALEDDIINLQIKESITAIRNTRETIKKIIALNEITPEAVEAIEEYIDEE